jgi:hypothetical protein
VRLRDLHQGEVCLSDDLRIDASVAVEAPDGEEDERRRMHAAIMRADCGGTMAASRIL